MPLRDRTAYNAYMKEYGRRRYAERRAVMVEHLGRKCIDCGTENGVELDHADRTTKAFSLAKRLTGAPLEVLYRELAKCALRCGPCHRVKTIRERGRKVRAVHLREHAERVAGAV